MKKLVVVAVVAGVLSLVGASAVRAFLPQVDPVKVPLGALVANNIVPTPLKLTIGSKGKEQNLPNGFEVFVRHIVFAPNQSSKWHAHPGTVLVTIVKGQLTLYGGSDESCTGRTFYAGSGFLEKGFGHVHAAIAGPDGADFYQIALESADSGDTIANPVTEGTPPCAGV